MMVVEEKVSLGSLSMSKQMKKFKKAQIGYCQWSKT